MKFCMLCVVHCRAVNTAFARHAFYDVLSQDNCSVPVQNLCWFQIFTKLRRNICFESKPDIKKSLKYPVRYSATACSAFMYESSHPDPKRLTNNLLDIHISLVLNSCKAYVCVHRILSTACFVVSRSDAGLLMAHNPNEIKFSWTNIWSYHNHLSNNRLGKREEESHQNENFEGEAEIEMAMVFWKKYSHITIFFFECGVSRDAKRQ